MSAARELSHHTLAHICQRFAMEEVKGADGGSYRPLISQMGPVGELRLFRGTAVCKLVYIGMTVPAFGLDSHMIFAFTPPDSPVPHFTLDSVMNATDFAFHLDLIPRVDLGANLDYLMAVYAPLDELFESTSKIEGLTPARLGPTQYALMSPWMLAYRANAQAFADIQKPVSAYLAHWSTLVETGLPQFHYDPSQLAARDRLNRDAIFNPQVDRVWAQVDRLLGAETSAFLRDVLKNQLVEV